MSSDADARFKDLLALIANPRAPLNPEYVAEEAEACALEVAAAARLAAVIAGAGFGRTQDWRAALDWLGGAADGGDAQARDELRLLAPGSMQAAWTQRAAGFDVAAWIAPRAPRVLNERPRIGVVDAFLEAPICAWMVARARTQLAPSMVYSQRGGGQHHEVRTNSEATFSIADLDVVMLLVRARIANTLGVDAAQLERFSVFHYDVGQRFGAHADYLDPAFPHYAADIARRGQRIATFLVYLNDAFEEGETQFIELDCKIKPPAGGAVFFYNVDESGAPEPLSLHEGLPPTQGEKWLLSQFVRDRAQTAA